MKLKTFIEDITTNNIFGKVNAFMYMKEDQKLGLPHVHTLLILHEDDAPKTPDDYDRLPCAEFPDRTENPKLYALVKKFTIHGPCTGVNPNSPCMEKIKCTKNFPRAFQEHTTHAENNFPTYRRRSPVQGGHTANIYVSSPQGEMVIDNQWVAPYNPVLLLQWHINVEIVATVRGVSYLYKYVTKGFDRIIVGTPNVELAVDEINRFQG